MIRFADLSHHQDVRLEDYARIHDRVVLKATEGTGFVDPTFADRWRLAGRLGLARIAYHYARNRFHGGAEFRLLWQTVQNADPLRERDRLCLDTEDTDNPVYAVREAEQFCSAALSMGATRGIVYTGNWYVKRVLAAGGGSLAANVFPPGWRSLWLSNYDPDVPDSEIVVPAGWSRSQIVARQYTDRATVAGVSSPCDYSRVLREWLPPITSTQEGDGMAADPEVLDALREIRNAIRGMYQAGFTAKAADGSLDATHEEVSIRGVNVQLNTISRQLAEVLDRMSPPSTTAGL